MTVTVSTRENDILCVRCHDLIHHSSGSPIYHPDIDDIRETIDESPYKYNHVYHVVDAADFPMSLLPQINRLLHATPLRSRNRRSQPHKFYGGRLTELSFVITRADLLAPRREQVDKLMPWIRDTLRDALGRSGRNVRLGNIHCVSARRNWWTKELREDIWKRGGATWLVGKANVGKSYLVHHVFPKGRMDHTGGKEPMLTVHKSSTGHYGVHQDYDRRDGLYDARGDTARASNLDETALLPPRPQETNYPQMPVVSALPGTTASPIRIPFGNGKGELIDLPGLDRTALVNYVEERHRGSLVMKSHVKPEQIVLKGPFQSLLLGGFIRITPRTPNLVFLTYNFTPLNAHRTMTEKAIPIQTQTSTLRVENIAIPGTGEKIALAGSFALKYDVTKVRAGPITRKDGIDIPVDRLPYRVVALDILIEGCGWVEIVAQVRAKDLVKPTRPEGLKQAAKPPSRAIDSSGLLQTLDLTEPEETDLSDAENAQRSFGRGEDDSTDNTTPWPVIDVYSPAGKFIGSRRPLNAWILAQPKSSVKKKRSAARPRRSLKGAKKRAKAELRAAGENRAGLSSQ